MNRLDEFRRNHTGFLKSGLIVVVFLGALIGWVSGWLGILGPDFLMPDYEHEVEWVILISGVLIATGLCFAARSILDAKSGPR